MGVDVDVDMTKICLTCDRPMEARVDGESVVWVCKHCDLMED